MMGDPEDTRSTNKEFPFSSLENRLVVPLDHDRSQGTKSLEGFELPHLPNVIIVVDK